MPKPIGDRSNSGNSKPGRHWTIVEIAEVAGMRRAGLPFVTIAKKMGRSRKACQNALYKHLERQRRKPTRQEPRDKMVEALASYWRSRGLEPIDYRRAA